MNVNFTLRHGDCLDVLRGMADDSVDSVVTDPPYGLSQHKPDEVVECLRAWLAGEVYQPKGKGFMGKAWDAWVPGPEVWRECLRVLKPGGHVLAFAGTRSMDLMSMAIRLAGFELRDAVGYANDGGGAPLLAWTFGSGFPKSHDVSQAIDREDGFTRDRVPHQLGKGFGDGVASVYASDAWTTANAGTRSNPTPLTEAAAQWQGWGSALKPAWEPIILGRKPLEGTLASNVLAWSTGGLNVDACRVATSEEINATRNIALGSSGSGVFGAAKVPGVYQQQAGGRWPANLIHDGSEEVLAGFPVTGASTQTAGVQRMGRSGGIMGAVGALRDGRPEGYNDAGSAARFFYCAKASRADRDQGLDGFDDKLFGMSSAASAAAARGEQYDNGDGGVNRVTLRRNTHPTVKPTDLMAYLCRLVTPPGGIVLDPFMGSGSTGKAAMREGFRFIGCELSAEYLAIARARIEHELARVTTAETAECASPDLFAKAV